MRLYFLQPNLSCNHHILRANSFVNVLVVWSENELHFLFYLDFSFSSPNDVLLPPISPLFFCIKIEEFGVSTAGMFFDGITISVVHCYPLESICSIVELSHICVNCFNSCLLVSSNI